MRVLVTGGAGYVGTHTLIELMAYNHEICVLDSYINASPVALDRVRGLSNGHVNATEGDVRDPVVLTAVMEEFRPDAVIHFAGLKAVGDSMKRPLEYYDVNVNGTIALLRAMDRVGCKQIIFSSSATVYGEPQTPQMDENHPLNPTNVYGRSKLLSENIISDWATLTDGSAALLRYFNPVGAHPSSKIGEDPEGIPDNLMPYIAQVAVGKRDSLSVFGNDYDTPDGTGLRDYIHVVDLARAHVAALTYTQTNNGARAFNIGTGEAYSVLQMVSAFAAASGRDIPYEIAPRRAGDIAAMASDPGRAQTELGWKAQHTLADMAQSTWDWQRANPNGYRDTHD